METVWGLSVWLWLSAIQIGFSRLCGRCLGTPGLVQAHKTPNGSLETLWIQFGASRQDWGPHGP